MARRKTSEGKDPKRVQAGKKAWLTRLRRKRDREIADVGESFIPGYGPVSHAEKALKTQREINKAKRKKTTRRK